MKTVFVVRSIPVRDARGAAIGWVRVDPLADGGDPGDLVYLRDGTSCRQDEAIERVARDSRLLYATQDEAARDGISRLRAAAARGDLEAA